MQLQTHKINALMEQRTDAPAFLSSSLFCGAISISGYFYFLGGFIIPNSFANSFERVKRKRK
jgi:hypothetical protein